MRSAALSALLPRLLLLLVRSDSRLGSHACALGCLPCMHVRVRVCVRRLDATLLSFGIAQGSLWHGAAVCPAAPGPGPHPPPAAPLRSVPCPLCAPPPAIASASTLGLLLWDLVAHIKLSYRLSVCFTFTCLSSPPSTFLAHIACVRSVCVYLDRRMLLNLATQPARP